VGQCVKELRLINQPPVEGTVEVTVGGDIGLSSGTCGKLASVPLASGDASLGKLVFVNVGELVDCAFGSEGVLPGCDVCCARFASRLVYALRLSFLRAGPGVTALVTAGEKGEGRGIPTGDCAMVLVVIGPEAESGVMTEFADGAASVKFTAAGISSRIPTGFCGVEAASGIGFDSETDEGHGGGGGCVGICELSEITGSEGASGISSTLGLLGAASDASSASCISTSAVATGLGFAATGSFVS
jgi:hypothetical protein